MACVQQPRCWMLQPVVLELCVWAEQLSIAGTATRHIWNSRSDLYPWDMALPNAYSCFGLTPITILTIVFFDTNNLQSRIWSCGLTGGADIKMSSNYFQMWLFGFVNSRDLPAMSLFAKNSPVLLRWTFWFSSMKLFCFAISNVFDCVVLIAAMSAVHTWIGWLVASWLETALNAKGHNHGVSKDTWHKKVLIHSCVLLD